MKKKNRKVKSIQTSYAKQLHPYVIAHLAENARSLTDMVDDLQEAIVHPTRSPMCEKRKVFLDGLIRDQIKHIAQILSDLWDTGY